MRKSLAFSSTGSGADPNEPWLRRANPGLWWGKYNFRTCMIVVPIDAV